MDFTPYKSKFKWRREIVTDSNLPLFTADEVQQHSTEKDAWIIHRGKVYDVSEFLERYPGGKVILLAYTACTQAYGVDEIKRNFMNTRLLGCM